jgi:uncharacterized repeat protein (TIGR03837 family)
MQWDLFCRVIDNHGDLGVCWRLAVALVQRGQRVRLWVDDATALAWMAGDAGAGVEVLDWARSEAGVAPGEVVVEAFGCALPEVFVRRMARAAPAPVWINLEYLTAQAYAERSHRLASPQAAGAGAGLRKWFYYPGYTAHTGGLLREPDLAARQRDFDATAWLARLGVARRPGERVVSVFCYEQAALPDLLDALTARPTVLLACIGAAQTQVRAALPGGARGALRVLALPALSQADYDHLLWASDLNFVRGEDSLVRAQWAAKPFVWQAYEQSDGAHHAKVQALLDRLVQGRTDALAAQVRALWSRWNAQARGRVALPALPPWQDLCVRWRHSLCAQPDLCTQLLGFVAETR